MRKHHCALVLLVILGGCQSRTRSDDHRAAIQDDARTMVRNTLDRLYTAQPKARTTGMQD